MAEHMDRSTSSVVLLVYDATKNHTEQELRLTINGIRMRGDIFLGGDKLIVLGVLHSFLHPMGYQMEARADSLFGTNARAMEEEVEKKTDDYFNMLQESAENCTNERVTVEVKIVAGVPTKKIVVQEAIACKAAWVILDRKLKKDLKFYLEHIPCKVALIQNSLSVDVLRRSKAINRDVLEQNFSYSVSKPVEVPFDAQHQGISKGDEAISKLGDANDDGDEDSEEEEDTVMII
ncbi:hypothetical protein FRX31_020161 [Thalictrum thalictroides]|uniref:Uncharacterized protein n=1 Tax=Thalictrum thalictroides TaxID=46969 RepID=A0A7J6VZE3_THATH|nr:hypothetical protein FRX31_020161 [Thalictrum thalictroides]